MGVREREEQHVKVLITTTARHTFFATQANVEC
jgi:hypothetical protein